MLTLSLKEEGAFLSGRTQANTFVNSKLKDLPDKIQISFDGIQMVTQSYMSELFVCLKNLGFKSSQIEIQPVNDEYLSEKITREIHRIWPS